jgi:DNA-binding transcriptional regulator YhcF (GntR family)
MYIEIDFTSDEAIYLQLCNQIIMGIATKDIQEGDSLPSVRALAETVGVNMHTVNKAYGVLQQAGFVKIDRRRGAVIAVHIDKLQALREAEDILGVVFARTHCRGVTRNEVHELVDRIYDQYERKDVR